jgi:hypothetical protein
MPTVTARELAQDAYEMLNVSMVGEAMTAPLGAKALRYLNRLLSQWRQRRMFTPLTVRERFDMIADKGGETNPYTIGTGGNFNTERPANQNSIIAVNLVLTSPGAPNEVRVPLGAYTSDTYFANQIPGMASGQPTNYYYNPTYADGLGSFYLWPVPNVATNDIEILFLRPLALFADLDTEYDVPDGADDALMYALMFRLAGTNGRDVAPEDRREGMASIAAYKRSCLILSDLQTDAYMLTGGMRGLYNINTGNM